MAQHHSAGAISPAKALRGACLFSVETDVTVRMVVNAENEEEGREIIHALLGGGRWTSAEARGIQFAVKAREPGS